MSEQMEQGSESWFAARAGKVTASRVADVIAKTRSGWGASRGNYMADLIVERLTGRKTDGFTSAAMQHGIDVEPLARNAYEFFADCHVELVGFIDHPTIAMSGASPDGLVGTDGLVEIKCPNTATHIDTLLNETIAEKYNTQMQWQMACTGRQWCDYVSFDSRLPVEHSFWCARIARDDATISELEEKVTEFLAELDAKLKQLNERLAS